MAMRLFRRRQRPIDRVKHTARRSALTARDTARRSSQRAGQWAGERMRDAQEEIAGRVLAVE
jgi:hypothetical protein